MERRLRVAVADTYALNRVLLVEILSFGGYKIVGIARSGAELVSMCRTANPDIVVTDLDLPQMPNLLTLHAAHNIRCPIPIVFLSCGRSGEILLNFPHAVCISKPFTASEILTAVQKAAAFLCSAEDAPDRMAGPIEPEPMRYYKVV